ncbi:MAG: hypothetical protein ACHQ16_07920, partial [Candidatus Lutacidiplasmatales archaeon]
MVRPKLVGFIVLPLILAVTSLFVLVVTFAIATATISAASTDTATINAIGNAGVIVFVGALVAWVLSIVAIAEWGVLPRWSRLLIALTVVFVSPYIFFTTVTNAILANSCVGACSPPSPSQAATIVNNALDALDRA